MVQRIEPSARNPHAPILTSFQKGLSPASIEHQILRGLGAFFRGHGFQICRAVTKCHHQRVQRFAFCIGWVAEALRGGDEIAVIGDSIGDQLAKQGLGRLCGTRRIAGQKTPKQIRIIRIHHTRQVQQHGEGNRWLRVIRRGAAMDMPGRVGGIRRSAKPRAMLQIFIHGAGDLVEVKPLRALRLVKHE